MGKNKEKDTEKGTKNYETDANGRYVFLRTKKLRNWIRAVEPKFCTERATIFTESWKKTEGKPIIIRKALAMAEYLSRMTIDIRPGELIVGH
jgi:pyruvate-formate lyase